MPKRRGPKPIEKTSTRTPKSRAITKWPHSWTKTMMPNPIATAMIPVSTLKLSSICPIVPDQSWRGTATPGCALPLPVLRLQHRILGFVAQVSRLRQRQASADDLRPSPTITQITSLSVSPPHNLRRGSNLSSRQPPRFAVCRQHIVNRTQHRFGHPVKNSLDHRRDSPKRQPAFQKRLHRDFIV